MSKVYLGNLKQHAAAVEGCIQDIESVSLNEYGEATEESEDLRNNWDLLYTELLDLIESLDDFLGEVE